MLRNVSLLAAVCTALTVASPANAMGLPGSCGGVTMAIPCGLGPHKTPPPRPSSAAPVARPSSAAPGAPGARPFSIAPLLDPQAAINRSPGGGP